jgi:hypothetical protein
MYDCSVRLHQIFPSLVVAIMIETDKQDACVRDEIDCIKSIHNPYGIPIWKVRDSFYSRDRRDFANYSDVLVLLLE